MADTNQPVRMWRSDEDAQGGPTVADVHPAEVESYRAGGWRTDAPAMGEPVEVEESTDTDAPKRGRKPKA